MDEITTGALYCHYSNYDLYQVFSTEAHLQVDNGWLPAVIYTRYWQGKSDYYIRTQAEFKEKFYLYKPKEHD